MAQPRTTALRRRLGGVVVGASVLASAIAISGTVPFETVSAFAVDTTCTPGAATLSAKKVEKAKEFTALVCGLKEGQRVRGEYRHASPSGSGDAAPTPVEGIPEGTAPLGYSREIAAVGADGRATVTFEIAEPGTYAISVAPLEEGTASNATVEITDQAPPPTTPAEPSDPAPSPTPTKEPPEDPTASPSPTPEPTPKPTSDPTPKPTHSPTAEPTPKPTSEPTPEPTPSPSPTPTTQPEPSPAESPSEEPEPTEHPTAAPSEPAVPSPSAAPSPLPNSGEPSHARPSEAPADTDQAPGLDTDGESGNSSTEAAGSDFVRPRAPHMSRIPARNGHGRSADFGAVGSDYSKLAGHGKGSDGVDRPGPTPGSFPAKPDDESNEGSTQLITDPSRQPLGLSVAWLIGGVIAGLGLAATGAIVLMRRNFDR